MVVTLAATGCGSSSSGDRVGLTAGQRQALVGRLEAVRSAAGAHDLPAARAALDEFRQSVVQLRRAGALDDATARSLRIGAARLLSRVRRDNPPAPAPTPPATQSTPAPAPPGPPGQKKKHDEKKPGHGNAKHGHGEEGGD